MALISTNGTHAGPTASATSLASLAANISEKAASLSTYLESQGHAQPSFLPGCADPPETEEYLTLHTSLTSSLEDLQRLVGGPRRSLRPFIMIGNNLATLQVAFDFGFFQLVPPEGSMDVETLAHKVGIDADRTVRVLRMLAAHRIFVEPKPGFFAHTAASVVFHDDEGLRCAGHYMLDECFKAATACSDCIKASPNDSDSTHSPFNTYFGVPMFSYYEQNPQFAARFAKAMAGNFPKLDFIVQDDSEKMLAQGRARNLSDIEGRISFMEHSFFHPQPIGGAGAFFICQCMHNWCDRDVVKILKSFVPRLENSAPGTPLLINDTVLPVPGSKPLHEERAQADGHAHVCSSGC
ncbi:hypothetical protein ACET3X_003197 [Alternaria dauci]|uniref:O-methyltransferase domain-containing protein n=1 Tax=Alternaria dauci TaxID=48095 RepID=A0ABR3USW3_9PLEO